VHDYKSLRLAVMTRTTLTQTHKQLLSGCTISSARKTKRPSTWTWNATSAAFKSLTVDERF